jgi:hypothetical protein
MAENNELVNFKCPKHISLTQFIHSLSYGMKGLLKAIKRNDELVLGHDLNKMGLDFTSKR